MKIYQKVVEQGQNLVDLTLQEYGDVELLPLVLFDNDISHNESLNSQNALNFRFNVPEIIEFERRQQDWFRRNQQRVKTSDEQFAEYWQILDGEFWGEPGKHWLL